MLGTDFPYRQFFPQHATVVQIDLRGEQLGRCTKLDYGFVGDTKATLQALLPKLEQNRNDDHLKASVEHYQKARKGLDELAAGEGTESRSTLNMSSEFSMSLRRKTRFSPATWAPRRFRHTPGAGGDHAERREPDETGVDQPAP